MSRYGLENMSVHALVDGQYQETGVLELVVTFEDAPYRVHCAAVPTSGAREAVIAMLRDLALQIEYDIATDLH